LTVSNSAAGFTAVIYWDKNNDGQLDPSDPVVTDLAALTGGSNGASTAAGLDAGESARLFVKVSAPAGATVGTSNVTTLQLAITGAIAGVVAPAAIVTTDTTAVISSAVTLVITQAVDAACDGTADGAFSITPIVGAAPNSCVRYQVTATNAGPVAVTSIVISVPTPAYTVYSNTVAAAASTGTVTAPADGSNGLLQVSVPSMAPGQAVVLTFGVRITP
jgi:nitrogen fixation protein FixH